jgi:hypothetical protein
MAVVRCTRQLYTLSTSNEQQAYIAFVQIVPVFTVPYFQPAAESRFVDGSGASSVQ